MKAVLLVSHGSRLSETKKEVEDLVGVLRKKSGAEIFEYAFLELESPSIPEGIKQCVGKGAKEIVVLQNFLNSGQHVIEDIPKIISEAEKRHPDVQIRLTKPIGQHPRIADLFLELI